MNISHILNGDALKEQFPAEQLQGEIIVARECLVDGDVSGSTPEDLFATRAASMQEMYGIPQEEYFKKTVPELTKITQIRDGEVNLWFEEDLFCQVNFWFVCSLLNGKDLSVNLVQPETDLRYGFAGLNGEGLISAFKQRVSINTEQLTYFSLLWMAYQNGDINELKATAGLLQNQFPFLKDAISAQIDRTPDVNGYGHPERIILEIMNDKVHDNFGVVFQEFNKRAPIYGFGDLQVKRLFDLLKK